MFRSQGDSFDIDHESSDSPREQTPDSDSGYMASCVTVVSATSSSSSRTFQQIPRQHHQTIEDQQACGVGKNTVTLLNAAGGASDRPTNFLAEIQSAQQKRRISRDRTGDNAISPSSPITNLVANHSVPGPQAGKTNAFSNSLADQLKSRLEERRRNSDEKEVNNLAADVQKAVNVANENSKLFVLQDNLIRVTTLKDM